MTDTEKKFAEEYPDFYELWVQLTEEDQLELLEYSRQLIEGRA